MTGTHLLIAAIFIVFVLAFLITVLVLNANTKKIISTNTKLVERQNTLLEQNKKQGCELEKRMSELEEQHSKLEEQKELIEALKRQQEELAEQLKHSTLDEVMFLREQTRLHREHIELTADMSDEELAILEGTFREMNQVEISYRETGYGTKLLIAKETGVDTDFVDILAIYKGYFIEFNMSPNPGAADQTLTDEQIQLCIDFLTDVDFNPV